MKIENYNSILFNKGKMDLKAVGKYYDVVHTGIELPSSLLENLEASDVYVFKLSVGDKEMYVGCNDFYESNVYGNEMVFIPEWMMEFLGVNFGETVRLEQIKEVPRADFICIKPQKLELFDSIPDIEDFFTFYLQNFKIIQVGVKYPVIVNEIEYYIYIDKLEKQNQALDFAVIVDVDLTTEFAPPVEKPPTPPPAVMPLPIPVLPTSQPVEKPDGKFKPFSGTGYKLGYD